MGRPRNSKNAIPNLYAKYDKRSSKVYFQYKHPITGKFHSLGSDVNFAKETALVANSRLNDAILNHSKTIIDTLVESKQSISAEAFVARYDAIQQERLDHGEIKLNTVKQKKTPINRLIEKFGHKRLCDFTVKDITELLDNAREKGERMAQVTRTVYIDFFEEAQRAGEVEVGFNPASATRKPMHKVKRGRLSLEQFKKMIEHDAHPRYQYIKNAMRLALITGQRAGDISKMKWSDIHDEHLHITQEKTGYKLAIPLAIKCEAIDMTLFQLLAEIDRQGVNSEYVIHFSHSTNMSLRGGKVTANTLSNTFKEFREALDIQTPGKTPPTFHEIRSLSARIYKKQGVHTQTLLGHASERQTERYNDERSIDYKYLVIN